MPRTLAAVTHVALLLELYPHSLERILVQLPVTHLVLYAWPLHGGEPAGMYADRVFKFLQMRTRVRLVLRAGGDNEFRANLRAAEAALQDPRVLFDRTGDPKTYAIARDAANGCDSWELGEAVYSEQ